MADDDPTPEELEEISARAWYALDDHKARCPRCSDPQWEMCETGRGLQNHLWDCRRAADAAMSP